MNIKEALDGTNFDEAKVKTKFESMLKEAPERLESFLEQIKLFPIMSVIILDELKDRDQEQYYRMKFAIEKCVEAAGKLPADFESVQGKLKSARKETHKKTGS